MQDARPLRLFVAHSEADHQAIAPLVQHLSSFVAQRLLTITLQRELPLGKERSGALQQAVAIDDSDAGPYLSMAKLFEVQKTFTRATESYKAAAQRSTSAVEAARALLQAAELLERKQNESDEALSLSLTALRKLLG